MKGIIIILVSTIGIAPLTAQKIEIDLVDSEVFPRVKVYATVSDRSGKPLCTLNRESFRLLEDGEPRKLRVLSGKATETSIGILLDESGSMGSVIENVRDAAEKFIDALSGNDRAAAYSFDHATHILHPIIDVSGGLNRKGLKESLQAYGQHGGGTEMYQAIADMIGNELAGEVERRRAIVALTDGVSGGSVEAAIQNAKANRVAVYTIGMGGVDRSTLTRLSGATGGKFYTLSAQPSTEELTQIYNEIRLRLECQYALIYDTPAVCPDGSEVPIEVTVPSLVLRKGGKYGRPLDPPRMDFNLFFANEGGRIPSEPPDPVECEKVRFLTKVQASSCSDTFTLEDVVVRAYDMRPGERVEVARSAPVSVRSNGEPRTVAVDWDTSSFPGQRNLEFVIDPVDEILERSEKDNLAARTIRVAETTHDLYIESIEYSPKPAAPCDQIEVRVRVDNGGKCKGRVLHDIEVRGSDQNQPLGTSTVSITSGKPSEVVFEWAPDGFIGFRPLTFVIDPDKKFGQEQTLDNNTKQALIEVKPVEHDLQPTGITHEPLKPIVGDVISFHVSVQDEGRCTAVPLGQPVRLRVSDANTRRILANSEPFSLETQSSLLVPVQWETKQKDGGARQIVVTVDAEGKIQEKTPPGKENNSLTYDLDIRPMPHDLVIVSATLTPENPRDGDPAILEVVIEDRARFPGVRLEGVRLKAFERYQGFLVGDSDPLQIISQQKLTIQFQIDTGGLAGQRELRIVADPDRKIDELTPEGLDGENNNEYFLRVSVRQ